MILVLLSILCFTAAAVLLLVAWQQSVEFNEPDEEPRTEQVQGSATMDRSLRDYVSLGSGVESFSGTVAAVIRECEADGMCRVVLADGKHITTGGGLRSEPENNVWGSVQHQALTPGTVVDVRAIKNTDSSYTLQRCLDCYVRPAAGAGTSPPQLQPS